MDIELDQVLNQIIAQHVTPPQEIVHRAKSVFEKVKDALQKILGPDGDPIVTEIIVMGSLRRNTAINPINDIDILVCFKKSAGFSLKDATGMIKSSSQLLSHDRQWVMQGHCIRGEMDGINFDVVPAFVGEDQYKYVTDQAGNLIATNPEKGARIIDEQNKAFNGFLAPSIRLLKSWNQKNSLAGIKPLKSYHLEVLCANIEAPQTCNHISSAFGYILSNLSPQILKTRICPPEFPPGSERNIASYLETDKNPPFTRVQLAELFDRLAREYARVCEGGSAQEFENFVVGNFVA